MVKVSVVEIQQRNFKKLLTRCRSCHTIDRCCSNTAETNSVVEIQQNSFKKVLTRRRNCRIIDT